MYFPSGEIAGHSVAARGQLRRLQVGRLRARLIRASAQQAAWPVASHRGVSQIILEIYEPQPMLANIVIDTSAILAVLLAEPEKQAVVEATMGSVLCAPASLRWEVGNAATAGVKRRRLTPERARQLVTDFEQVTIRELAIDFRRAVDLGLELGIYAYDAYILEAARSSGFPLLALDGPIRRNAKKLGLTQVELDL